MTSKIENSSKEILDEMRYMKLKVRYMVCVISVDNRIIQREHSDIGKVIKTRRVTDNLILFIYYSNIFHHKMATRM